MRHRDVPDEWNGLTKAVITCAVEVHSILGPGLLERLYEEALVYELRSTGLKVSQQVPIRIRYKDIELGEQRIDVVINDLVVVELKAVERVIEAHRAQLLSYLRSVDMPLGLLINFHGERLSDGVHRLVNARSSRFSRLDALPRVSPLSPLPPRSDLGAPL